MYERLLLLDLYIVGKTYKDFGLVDEMDKVYEEALKIIEKQGHIGCMPLILKNYYSLGKIKKSKQTLKKAVEIAQNNKYYVSALVFLADECHKLKWGDDRNSILEIANEKLKTQPLILDILDLSKGYIKIYSSNEGIEKSASDAKINELCDLSIKTVQETKGMQGIYDMVKLAEFYNKFELVDLRDRVLEAAFTKAEAEGTQERLISHIRSVYAYAPLEKTEVFKKRLKYTQSN